MKTIKGDKMTNKEIEENLKHVLMSTIKGEDLHLLPPILVDVFTKISDTKMSRNYKDQDIFKNYLRAISRNLGSSVFETLRLVKEVLENWDVNRRLDFISTMGKTLIEFLYGHPVFYYQELDRSIKSINKVREDDGHYHYIALGNGAFVDNFLRPIHKIYGHRKSFIDVGCGIGDKILLAWLSGLFDECYGIEYSKLTYEIAYKIFGKLRLYDGVIYGNAFGYNFEPYDTIYSYCPISDGETMHRLYVHIFGQIKRGAIMKEMLPESGMRNFLDSNGISVGTNRMGIIQKVYSRKHKKCVCKYVKHKE